MRYHTPTASLRQLALRRPLVAVGALLSANLFALTFVAAPVHAAPSANTRCIQEAVQAGLLSPDRNPGNTNFVGGTDGDDSFNGMATAGQDVFCGFDGNDSFGFLSSREALEAGDVFLGGAGNDSVDEQSGGTFNGGAGSDSVNELYHGTFNGGAGDDVVSEMWGDGTFNGEAGNDGVSLLYKGIFNGGAGDDRVVQLVYGTFNQD